MDFRKKTNISVNCVVLGFDMTNINILLSKRTLCMYDDRYPVIDDWILTGNHIYKSERLDEAASRIFKGLTGIGDTYMEQFHAFGNPDRIKNDNDLLWVKSRDTDPGTTSVAYYFLLNSRQITLKDKDTQWFSINNLPTLGFDHKEIISQAYQNLRQKVMREPIIFEFLEDKFTLNDLQLAYESILDTNIDNRNFRKKVLKKKYIIPLDEKQVGVSKRPSQLYMFSRDVYKKISEKSHIINI